jgi:hypothetical protein
VIAYEYHPDSRRFTEKVISLKRSEWPTFLVGVAIDCHHFPPGMADAIDAALAADPAAYAAARQNPAAYAALLAVYGYKADAIAA